MFGEIANLIQGAGDPTLVARLLPDSGVWPHYLAIMLRAYRVPEYLYWIGLFLLLASIPVNLVRYMSGSGSLLESALRLGTAAILWKLTVVTPAMNGCSTAPQYANLTPCVLEGNWRATKEKLEDTTVEVPYLDSSGNLQVKEVPVNLKPMIRITFDPKPASGMQNDSPAGLLLKGAWSQMNRISNRALFNELARQQPGIAEVKQAVNQLFVQAFVWNSATSLGSMAGRFLSAFGTGISLLPGLGKVAGGALVVGGNLLETASDTATQMVRGLGGALISAMVFGPVAMLTVYHAMNTLSGALLYVILFGSPVILGLVGFFGPRLLAGAARLVLLSLLMPLITGAVFGAAVRMVYGDYQEKGEQIRKLTQLSDTLLSSGDSSRLFRVTQMSTLAATQAANTYMCLSTPPGQKPAGVVCPEGHEGLFYRDQADYAGKVNALKQRAGQGLTDASFLLQYANSLPALIHLPSGQDPQVLGERYREAFKGAFGATGTNPGDILQSRPKYEAFLSLVRGYGLGFVWSWPLYVSGLKRDLGLSGSALRCNDPPKGKGYMGAVVACLDEAMRNGSTDYLDREAVKKAVEAAKDIDKKLSVSGYEKKALLYSPEAWNGSFPPLPANSGTSLDSFVSSPQANSYAIGVAPSGTAPWQPTAPYPALDAAYVSFLITGAMPEALQRFARDTTVSTVVSTLISTLISILIMGVLWGLLGQLFDAAAHFSTRLPDTVGGFLAGSAAISGINLAANVPKTSGMDRAGEAAGRRLGTEVAGHGMASLLSRKDPSLGESYRSQLRSTPPDETWRLERLVKEMRRHLQELEDEKKGGSPPEGR